MTRRALAEVLATRRADLALEPVDRAVLVKGDAFPDGLSIGPLAGVRGWPVLLTPTSGPLPSATAAAFDALGATSVLRVGTWAAPPPSVTEVESLVGTDRYETGVLVAEYGLTRGLGAAHLALAKGDLYPDALVAGPYLARRGGSLLLTQSSGLPASVASAVVRHRASMRVCDLIGLPQAIEAAMRGHAPSVLPVAVILGDAGQVITVRTSGSTASIRAWERAPDGTWSSASGLGPMAGFVGRNGVRVDKHEGDGATPEGTFTLTEAFGNAADPGSGLPYRRPDASTYWVSDPKSPVYNTWQRHGPGAQFDPSYGERLAAYPTSYRHAVVVDYNRFPVTLGAGSAIFLHVSDGRPTSGCITVPLADLVALMRWLDPAERPRMAIR